MVRAFRERRRDLMGYLAAFARRTAASGSPKCDTHAYAPPRLQKQPTGRCVRWPARLPASDLFYTLARFLRIKHALTEHYTRIPNRNIMLMALSQARGDTLLMYRVLCLA